MSNPNIDINVSGPVQAPSTYKTKVLKGTQSFASQVTEENTKYVIKYDFDLGGESVTIPENCVLEFDGGSLSNGKIKSNATKIIGDFDYDILIGYAYDIYGNQIHYKNYTIQPSEDITFASYKFEFGGIDLHMYQTCASDLNYIYCIGTNSNNTRLHIILSDYNNNIIGYCSCATPDGFHPDQSYIVDDILYISGSSKIVKCSISTIITSCESHLTDVDFTEITLPVDSFTFMSYDYGLHKTYLVDSSQTYVCNSTITLIESVIPYGYSNISAVWEEKGSFSRQGVLSYNGRMVFCGHYKEPDNTMTMWISCLCTYDIYNGIVGDIQYIENYTGSHWEIEGITIDYSNDDGLSFITTGNVWGEENFNTIGILHLYKESIGVNLLLKYDISLKEYYDRYVDNTFTGRSHGDSNSPYKNISTCLLNSSKTSDLRIIIKNNGEPYYVRGNIGGVNLRITSLNENDPATIVCRNLIISSSSVSQISNVNLQYSSGTILKFNNVSRVSISKVNVDGISAASVGIRIENSMRVNLGNVTIDNCAKSLSLYASKARIANSCVFQNATTAIELLNESYLKWNSIYNPSSYVNCTKCLDLSDYNSELSTVYIYSNDNYSNFLAWYAASTFGTQLFLMLTTNITNEATRLYCLSGFYLYYGGRLRNMNNYTIAHKTIKGTSDPIMSSGDSIFDDQLDVPSPVWWNGTKRVSSDGATSTVKRKGLKSERPSGTNIYVGFQYMQVDSTNGTFPIWASAISGSTVTWVKADGTNPDA